MIFQNRMLWKIITMKELVDLKIITSRYVLCTSVLHVSGFRILKVQIQPHDNIGWWYTSCQPRSYLRTRLSWIIHGIRIATRVNIQCHNFIRFAIRVFQTFSTNDHTGRLRIQWLIQFRKFPHILELSFARLFKIQILEFPASCRNRLEGVLN